MKIHHFWLVVAVDTTIFAGLIWNLVYTCMSIIFRFLSITSFVPFKVGEIRPFKIIFGLRVQYRPQFLSELNWNSVCTRIYIIPWFLPILASYLLRLVSYGSLSKEKSFLTYGCNRDHNLCRIELKHSIQCI